MINHEFQKTTEQERQDAEARVNMKRKARRLLFGTVYEGATTGTGCTLTAEECWDLFEFYRSGVK